MVGTSLPIEIERSFLGALAVCAGSACSLTHDRSGGVEFMLDDIQVAGTVELMARPTAGVLICHAQHGVLALREQGESLSLPMGEPVLAAPGLPWTVRVTDCRVRLTSIRSSVLSRLADELHLPVAESPLLFRSGRVAPRRIGVWNRSVDYVGGMSDSDVSSTELVGETCGRVLAAATLLCFPRTATQDVDGTATEEHVPQQLRSLLAFVGAHARDDVGIREIADVAHLSPRAVQYLFRKHLDTTPTEYLRRVRLQGAHRDLVSGDHAMTTVGEVAAKWRFGHTGRFAAAYRQTFGHSPHYALRR